jgi:pilus assembly protein Flp/PilA
MSNLQQFLNDEHGQSMVEYGVLVGSVSAATYIGVDSLSLNTGSLFTWVADQLPQHPQAQQDE